MINSNTLFDEQLMRDYCHIVRHEVINYLNNISLRLQLDKSRNEIVNYIEELSLCLYQIGKLIKDNSFITGLWIQQLLMRLISAGYQLSCGEAVTELALDSDDIQQLDKIIDSLIKYSTSVSESDKLVEIIIEIDGKLSLNFPYIEKSNIIRLLRDTDIFYKISDNNGGGTLITRCNTA